MCSQSYMRWECRWRKDMADEKIARTELPADVVAVPAATAAMHDRPAKATCMSKERPAGGEAGFYFDRSILNRRGVADELHDKYGNGVCGGAFSKHLIECQLRAPQGRRGTGRKAKHAGG